MEPQLEGCGKRNCRICPLLPSPASMEPQLEGCGKRHAETVEEWAKKLQWSRNLRVAESIEGRPV